MSKSIIIFGKGPSVLKCTKEIVDQYDEIAICNYPILNDFFYSLIKDRIINFHFANCGTFDERYTNEINNQLHIQNIINTNKGVNKYQTFLKNNKLIKESIRDTMLEKFKDFKLDPNTGSMALQYILDTNNYNKIALMGFDNFKKGEQIYYYKPNEYNDKIKYLINQNIITQNGIFNIDSLHDTNKTEQYYNFVFYNYKNIKFELISNINLEYDMSNCIKL